jgi:hypothetical protein
MKCLAGFLLGSALLALFTRGDGPAATQTAATKPADPENPVDSFKFYGPNGLWKTWTPEQRLGRDTWIFWTWGNQKFLRKVAVLAGNLSVPISLDFFRLLDSRNRGTRFRDFGLVNEPNCEGNNQPDRYGLYLDTWKGDPLKYYPIPYSSDPKDKPSYSLTYPGTTEPVDQRHYGRPTGVVGLRLFDNPRFDAKKWSVEEYFRNPAKVEPPYLVGFSCAFCHVSFNALNPPKDPENPRWENLAANVGNQFFREGEMLLGKGRVLFGDKNPLPSFAGDPYKTRGLSEKDFIYHYAVSQQPGTSETSRISYDFINNPNTINPMFNLAYRPYAEETNTNGKKQRTWHILKDGADSVGVEWALMRVPINIGCEGEYWLSRLFDPVTGTRQRPFRIAEVLSGLPESERKKLEDQYGLRFQDVTPERLAELKTKYTSAYGETFGQDWQEAWRRHGSLAAYLTSYPAAHLKDAVKTGNEPWAKEVPRDQLQRGQKLFAEHCARCHSSKPPEQALAEDFRDKNFLSDDRRYPVTELGTNMARALATNAVDMDIWAEFSSKDYKALPPVGRVVLEVPVFPPDAPLPWSVKKPIRIDFEPPGGGRGYYRTPSLVSAWATAPYFHNNALGDYYVVRDDGTKGFFPNDGRRIGRRLADGSWVDFRIDVSVEGRLKMFEDGMDKLLNPPKRRRWVKRTTTDSTLVPDLQNSARQLLVAVIRDVVRRELATWLKEQQVTPGLADEALRGADALFDKAIGAILDEAKVSLRFGLAAVQMRLRDHADRLFDWLYDDLQVLLADKLKNQKLPLDKLKPALRKAFLARLDGLDQRLREAVILKVPAGTPVNLYANLNSSALIYAVLAHVRHHDDPRALAEALLRLSDCPDLVEDSGHPYGWDLSDQQKQDLIAFLKTL